MTAWLAFLTGCWLFMLLYELAFIIGSYDEDWFYESVEWLTWTTHQAVRILVGATVITLGYSLAMLIGAE